MSDLVKGSFPITRELFGERAEVQRKLGELEQPLFNRINYVIESAITQLGGTVAWWDWKYPDGPDSIDNVFQGGDYFFPIDWEVDGLGTDDTWIIDKYGIETCLFEGFPVRWLFEEFESEVTEGRQKWADAEAKRLKSLRAYKKTKKQQLIASAKNKLTPEERKALGIE